MMYPQNLRLTLSFIILESNNAPQVQKYDQVFRNVLNLLLYNLTDVAFN